MISGLPFSHSWEKKNGKPVFQRKTGHPIPNPFKYFLTDRHCEGNQAVGRAIFCWPAAHGGFRSTVSAGSKIFIFQKNITFKKQPANSRKHMATAATSSIFSFGPSSISGCFSGCSIGHFFPLKILSTMGGTKSLTNSLAPWAVLKVRIFVSTASPLRALNKVV